MKPKLTFAWFVVSLALAAILIVQWRTGSQRKLSLEKIQVQYEKLDQQEKIAQARTVELEKETRQLRAQMRAAEVELSNVRLSYNAMLRMTNAGPQDGVVAAPKVIAGGEGMGNLISKMMTDPEMRKAMAAQQRMGLDMVYGSLYKKLAMTPEQEKTFKEAMINLQMTNMAQAGAMFDPSNTNRAALIEKMGKDRESAESQIKEVLGEEKYMLYQDYTQTIGERMLLDQFSKQTELPQAQQDQLLAIMREEKMNMQINTGGNAFENTKDWQKIMESGEATEAIFAQQERMNERVLERASQVLTPDQMLKFRPLVTNQVAMQRASLKMAQQMFKGAGAEPVSK